MMTMEKYPDWVKWVGIEEGGRWHYFERRQADDGESTRWELIGTTESAADFEQILKDRGHEPR